jgi:hypothetical protein
MQAEVVEKKELKTDKRWKGDKWCPNPKGRPKGIPNKLTQTVRDAILESFDMAGGSQYLAKMAIEQPVAYLSLLGKVLPTQVKMEVNQPVAITFQVVEAAEVEQQPAPIDAEYRHH